MNETTTTTPKRGDICANGATIIDIKASAFGGWIVLCLFTQSKYDPYVTWWAWINDTGEIRTSMGHYYDQLSHAIVDFDNRF
jgi:hypothetical protein